MRENLYGRGRRGLEEILRPLTGRPFHARQLFGWIYSRGEGDLARMPDLPRPLRAALAERFRVTLPAAERRQESKDGAVKYLLRLEDGKAVESVYIPEKKRITF